MRVQSRVTTGCTSRLATKRPTSLSCGLPNRHSCAAQKPLTTVRCSSDTKAQGDQQAIPRKPVLELTGPNVTNLFSATDSSNASASSSGDESTHTADTLPQVGGEQPLPERVRQALKSWFLPAGFPASTSPDYLDYQLITFPTHVLGWLAHSLTTSSLLSAVGLSAGPVGTVATSAGIKWITKDGIGTLGRFFVGGRLAQEFDDDPRFWRMAGEGLSTLGAGLEIATVAYPQQFLLLASAGNFTRALSKSLGRPVFRVIQTHFAASNNVGAVAAKEEVWEVSAELVGTVSSLALLNALAALPDDGSVDKAAVTVTTWAIIQAVHVGLRYLAMKSLQFPTMSEKRVRLLVTEHVQGQPLSNVKDANKAEPMFELYPKNWVPFPKVHLGTESVQDCLLPSTMAAAPVMSTAQPSMTSASPMAEGSASMQGQAGHAYAHQLGEAHAQRAPVSSSSQLSGARFGHSSNSSSSISSSGSEASSSGAASIATVTSLASHSQDSSRGRSSALPPQPAANDVQGSNQEPALHSLSSSSVSPQAVDPGSTQTSTAATPSPQSSAHSHASNVSTTFPSQDSALSSTAGAARSVSDALQRYLALYNQEQHMLVWRDGEAHVLLHEGAEPRALLQAMWQAAWLHNHQEQMQPQHLQQQHLLSGSPSPAEEASLHALRQRFPSFVQEAGALGYELDRVSVHRGVVRVRVGQQ